jgi:putative transposase
VCRKHGISSATFYKWKAKYGGMNVSDAKRLKSLEDENAKLKKLLAGAMPDTPLPGLRVVRELDALMASRGRPAMIVSDNGAIPVRRSCAGRSRRGSNGTTSHRAGPSRMPLSRASIADCATSC